MIEQLGQTLKYLREDLIKCNPEDRELISDQINSLENELAFFVNEQREKGAA